MVGFDWGQIPNDPVGLDVVCNSYLATGPLFELTSPRLSGPETRSC